MNSLLSGLRLLLADDDLVGLARTRVLLRGLGCDVDAVPDGSDAIRRMRTAPRNRYQLVVTDYHMPGMDGGEVIDWMRDDDRWAAVPIILFSATAAEFEVRDLIALPRVSFLAKPASRSLIEQAIQAALQPSNDVPVR